MFKSPRRDDTLKFLLDNEDTISSTRDINFSLPHCNNLTNELNPFFCDIIISFVWSSFKNLILY